MDKIESISQCARLSLTKYKFRIIFRLLCDCVVLTKGKYRPYLPSTTSTKIKMERKNKTKQKSP